MRYITFVKGYSLKERMNSCFYTIIRMVRDVIYVISIGYIVTDIGLWAEFKI